MKTVTHDPNATTSATRASRGRSGGRVAHARPVGPRARAAVQKRRRREAEAPVPERGLASANLSEHELLARYAPVVQQIVGGFQRRLPRNVLREDLIAAGTSGLWDAIRKHAGELKETNFDWYVRVRIRGAILDELRAQDWLPRRARAAAEAAAEADGSAAHVPCVVRFDEVSELEQARCLATASQASSEAILEAQDTRAALVAAVNRLPERERHIVAMHYFRGKKFKDLGAELGVSEPRISQLHSRAMGRLRDLLDPGAL